jgi:hypothetical protein
MPAKGKTPEPATQEEEFVSFQQAAGGEAPADTTPTPVEPVAAGAPEPVAEPVVPPAPPEQETSPLLQSLQESGVADLETEEDALKYVQDLRSRQAELEQYANYGRQIAPYAQDVNQYLQDKHQQRQQPQPEPEPETPAWQTHEQSFWKKPEYDPSWEQMVRLNSETGAYEGINAMVPAQVVQGVQQYKNWQRQSLEKLVENPLGLVREGLEPWMQNFVQEQIQGVIQQQQQQQEMQAVERELQDVIYQRDPGTGVPIVDPATGQYALNEYGNLLVQEMQTVSDLGIQDPRQIRAMAESNIKAKLYDYQQQQQQAPTDAAGAPPNIPAAPVQPVVAPSQPPAPQTQFLENAKRKAAHTPSLAGSLGNQQVTPEAAGISADSENFFSEAAKQQGHIQ